MEFKRENRYIVFKISDFEDALSRSEEKHLFGLSGRVDRRRVMRGKLPLTTLVIESDWPEYEPTWDAIQRRVEGAPSLESELRAEIDRLHSEVGRLMCDCECNRIQVVDRGNSCQRVIDENTRYKTAIRFVRENAMLVSCYDLMVGINQALDPEFSTMESEL